MPRDLSLAVRRIDASPRRYSLYGLRLESDLALPELIACAGGESADVTVRAGRIDASSVHEAGLHVSGEGLLLVIEDVARYWVQGGSTVVVEAADDAPQKNVRLYLLGSVLGLLLHQRGLLPLHANAVEADGRAVLFMGASGEGKSTLAAWFHDRGHRVMADDVCVVGCRAGGPPLAMPGVPRLRLWRDALEATGRSADRYDRSYGGDEDYDKYDVPIATTRTEPLEIAAIYLLGRSERLSIEPIDGLAAAEALFAHTYRGGYLRHVDDPSRHWLACVELMRAAPMFSLERTRDPSRFDSECREILAHVERTCRK